MPSWNDILNEINNIKTSDALDIVRRKYLKQLSDYTGRNVIAYYSAFLDRPGIEGIDINDNDINALMAVIHNLDRSKGLDLILHTPGGGLAATESIVNYLRKLFGNNVRAVIPQIAMSAGTMIACSCKSILMGKQSSIGPIDPQFRGVPAQGVVDEFTNAIEAVKADPATIEIWKTIISQYPPTFIGECVNAIKMSQEIVSNWLETNMFEIYEDRTCRAENVVKSLSDHNGTKMHARHIDAIKAKSIGLEIEMMEDDNELQDKILTVHHSYMQAINRSSTKKIVENQNGVALIQQIPVSAK